LYSSLGSIGKPSEKVDPVSTACAIESVHWEMKSFARASWSVSGVLMNASRSGSIVRGVKTWSRRSPAVIRPPPLPRTSTIRPSCGSSEAMRTNSETNASASSTLNVQMRM
jgi:hypothetical protein